jgi:hypothetical protein
VVTVFVYGDSMPGFGGRDDGFEALRPGVAGPFEPWIGKYRAELNMDWIGAGIGDARVPIVVREAL